AANETRPIVESQAAAMHCAHGSRVVQSVYSKYRRSVPSCTSALISACATREPKISPSGPLASNIRLRPWARTVPSESVTTAPTGIVPAPYASHESSNAGRHAGSSSAQTSIRGSLDWFMPAAAYPTDAHERAAVEITQFFAERAETEAVLLTNSCARGKATPDSCLD